MTRLLKNICLIYFLLFFFPVFIFAEEITITTYYPSPYGVYKNLNIYNTDENVGQTNFTQAVTNAGLLFTTDYTDTAYTPGIFWSTLNNNPTKPKAGIYLMETGTGTRMYFGTSNNYATGITNDALVINESGNVGIKNTSPTEKLHLGEGNIYLPAASTNNGALVGIASSDNFTTNSVVMPHYGIKYAIPSDASGANLLASGYYGIRLFVAGGERVRVLSTGVGIGTTTPGTYQLYVNGTGYLGAAAWVYSSDRRLKENISYIQSGLPIIEQLKPVKFDYIKGDKKQVGFIAQEVEKVLPDIVTKGADGMLGMKTESIIPYLVKAIQEQQAEIKALKAKLNSK